MTQVPTHFKLGGGLDLVSAPVGADPGRAISALNHEPTPQGYQRSDGYERYSGMPKPSEATYWVLGFMTGTVEIERGQIVTGSNSLSTAEALYDAVLLSGTYGGGDAAGYVVLTGVDGDFLDMEPLEVSGVVAFAAGTPAPGGASSDADDATWAVAAIELARSRIGAVPGSGPVRGVWGYLGTAYAFRDSLDGTEGVMYAATQDVGWEAMNLCRTLAFEAGVTEILDGDFIRGDTSGAGATVSRVIVVDGDWTTSDAQGRLILAFDQSGEFIDGEPITVLAVPVAVAVGVSTANTLPPGGAYEFRNHNFFGSTDTKRMYGVNGVGPAFEWDGAIFVPILTGMADDTPDHIAVNHQHLFLSFLGGSIQNSGTGDPYAWSPRLGAGEIGMGDDITGFVEDFASVMAVMCRNKIAVLYGSDNSDWDLEPLATEAGGIAGTVQKLTAPIYMDDHGLRDMRTSGNFGDFRMGGITQLVDPLFTAKKKAKINPVASLRCRAKDQYRLFWEDGTGVYVYLGNKVPEILPFDLSRIPTCVCSSENNDGAEIMLFGDEDGFVYQLDAGTSWDGEPVEAAIRLSFFHAGSPDYNKRWHAVTVDCEAQGTATIGLSAEFDFGDAEQASMTEKLLQVLAGGGLWNEVNWGQFYWSNPIKGHASTDIDGEGGNISVAIVSRNTYERPYTVTGVRFRYSMRGLKRAA